MSGDAIWQVLEFSLFLHSPDPARSKRIGEHNPIGCIVRTINKDEMHIHLCFLIYIAECERVRESERVRETRRERKENDEKNGKEGQIDGR